MTPQSALNDYRAAVYDIHGDYQAIRDQVSDDYKSLSRAANHIRQAVAQIRSELASVTLQPDAMKRIKRSDEWLAECIVDAFDDDMAGETAVLLMALVREGAGKGE